MLFEACVDSVASARAAIGAGAGRLELCDSLVEGGVTPSLGKVEAVVAVCAPSGVPVRVLIRPRGGDFCYTPDELSVMLADIRVCGRARVAGVVLGALTSEGAIDEGVMRTLVECAAACGLAVTLHRAVDASRDPLEALDVALRLRASGGVFTSLDAVLTSGGAETAEAGARAIAAMVVRARHSGITIVAGGGVTPDNASALVRGAGVMALHGTARGGWVDGAMTFRRDPPVWMGASRDARAEYARKETSAAVVTRIISAAAEVAVDL